MRRCCAKRSDLSILSAYFRASSPALPAATARGTSRPSGPGPAARTMVRSAGPTLRRAPRRPSCRGAYPSAPRRVSRRPRRHTSGVRRGTGRSPYRRPWPDRTPGRSRPRALRRHARLPPSSRARYARRLSSDIVMAARASLELREVVHEHRLALTRVVVESAARLLPEARWLHHPVIASHGVMRSP